MAPGSGAERGAAPSGGVEWLRGVAPSGEWRRGPALPVEWLRGVARFRGVAPMRAARGVAPSREWLRAGSGSERAVAPTGAWLRAPGVKAAPIARICTSRARHRPGTALCQPYPYTGCRVCPLWPVERAFRDRIHDVDHQRNRCRQRRGVHRWPRQARHPRVVQIRAIGLRRHANATSGPWLAVLGRRSEKNAGGAI